MLASRLFFWLTAGFFVVQSAWIALSARYPQAFDEQFHFGIIQVYARHWLPFLKTQPPDADPYGAVTRDPSFLYHYAMSFPYRIIGLFTHDQTVQIILLRFANIALFVFGLVLFRRLLRRAGLSSAAANAGSFIMTFIPVAPQLAGQINYDNLLIPLTAWACLLAFGVIDQLKERRFTVQRLLALAAVCLAASMVKYEFLPIFLGIALFLAVFGWRRLAGGWRTAWRRAVKDWRQAAAPKWLLAAAFTAMLGLFAQRDLGNMLTYHTVVPDCSQVLTLNQCDAYSVWTHDQASHQAVVNHDVHADPNPLGYLFEWVYWLWYRLFFAINGPDGFVNYPPLPLPAAAFAVLVVASAAGLVMHGRRTFNGWPYRALLGVVVAVYLLTMLAVGYLKYLDTGVLELMNGRYLFPVLLPAAAVAYPALVQLARRLPEHARYGAAAVLLLCFLEGGGVFTFISRSDHTWYWPNAAVQRMNDDAKKTLEPALVDGPRYYSGSRWFFN